MEMGIKHGAVALAAVQLAISTEVARHMAIERRRRNPPRRRQRTER